MLPVVSQSYCHVFHVISFFCCNSTVVERSRTVAWCHCAWLSITKGSWERCWSSWLVFFLWERNQWLQNTHISWYEWKRRAVSLYTLLFPFMLPAVSPRVVCCILIQICSTFLFSFQIVRGLWHTIWWCYARLRYHAPSEEFIRACWKWLKKPREANPREGRCFFGLWLPGTQLTVILKCEFR